MNPLAEGLDALDALLQMLLGVGLAVTAVALMLWMLDELRF
jgi:hypothetical protein